MKRLLVLGASYLQKPAIDKAKEMGLYVGALDCNPKAAAASCAHEFFQVSTIDEEGVYRTSKEFKADGIVTLATDMPMRSLANACEKLGLSGIDYDTAVKATDKGEMLKAFAENSVAHPAFVVLTAGRDLPDNLTYPCIVKPADNSGSRGVVLVSSPEKIGEALEYSLKFSRNGTALLTEYMQGPEVSVEVMVVDGQVKIVQITDKITSGSPFFVEMGHSQPSRLPDQIKKGIEDLTTRAVKAVGIKSGPAHVEVIVTEDGPKMVELGARLGGDYIATHLTALSTGVDLVKATIQLALGEEPDLNSGLSKGAAIRYYEAPQGRIRKISDFGEAEKTPGVKKIYFSKKEGEMSPLVTCSLDRVGFVITQEETAEAALDLAESVLEGIEFEVEGD